MNGEAVAVGKGKLPRTHAGTGSRHKPISCLVQWGWKWRAQPRLPASLGRGQRAKQTITHRSRSQVPGGREGKHWQRWSFPWSSETQVWRDPTDTSAAAEHLGQGTATVLAERVFPSVTRTERYLGILTSPGQRVSYSQGAERMAVPNPAPARALLPAGWMELGRRRGEQKPLP